MAHQDQPKHIVFDIVGTLVSHEHFYEILEQRLGENLKPYNASGRLLGYAWLETAEREYTYLSLSGQYVPFAKVFQALFFRVLHFAGVPEPRNTCGNFRSRSVIDTDIEVNAGCAIPRIADMNAILKLSDDKITEVIEGRFVNCDIYLAPGHIYPISVIAKHRRDWASNDRGIYYRHHCSPLWASQRAELWIPTVGGRIFDSRHESRRRERAREFLQHATDNKRWNKSEYAWEADAWNHVFGRMRSDPALAADKREYYTKIGDVFPVSHTLTGDSKLSKRIPDATFGLVTFQPKHYQNAVAEYDLDSERPLALILHRDCGLISNPRCGEADLVFPFAVYEAKGWSGDPHEARLQACAAGAKYLDLLDSLAQCPGRPGRAQSVYQYEGSGRFQVFAFTSFGSYWHIMWAIGAHG